MVTRLVVDLNHSEQHMTGHHVQIFKRSFIQRAMDAEWNNCGQEIQTVLGYSDDNEIHT